MSFVSRASKYAESDELPVVSLLVKDVPLVVSPVVDVSLVVDHLLDVDDVLVVLLLSLFFDTAWAWPAPVPTASAAATVAATRARQATRDVQKVNAMLLSLLVTSRQR